jgi:hypothetical protein
MRRFRPCVLLPILLALGCAQGHKDAPQAKSSRPVEAPAREAAPAGAGAAQGEPNPEAKPLPRKIIYTANVDLLVDDLAQAEGDLNRLLEQHGAYVARSEIRAAPGSPRTGTWTLRVPVEKFPAFLQAVSALGEVRRSTTDSEDITDRYYDLAAHIKTDETEEDSLRKLLEKSSGRLEDVLTVRRELTAVRGRIEEQKGRLQRWDKETQLATVALSLLDRKDYTPPIAPDFGGNLGRTLQGSLDALVSTGKVILLVVVALLPWLMVLSVLAFPLLLWRRRRRKAARPEPPVEVMPIE